MRFRNYDRLRSFLVVARQLNMGRAAAELHVTKGAVSYQITQLEAELGFDLFCRSRRQLALTLKGEELFRHAEYLFRHFEQKLGELKRESSARITIGMATYFASRWLSPRLMHFIAAHPEIALRIQPLVDPSDLHSNELDLAIRWGRGEWREQGLENELIFPCPAMLTCSRKIGLQIESEGVEAVVQRETLLHDRDASEAWMDWFDAAGLTESPGTSGLVIPDPNVRVQAVIDGQGIALYDFLVDDEVASGRLYQYQTPRLEAYGYYLIYPRGLSPDSATMIFRDWIRQQARIDEDAEHNAGV